MGDALVPLLPLFFTGATAVVAAVAAATLGLFVIGAAITLLTGRSAVYSGARQVAFGLVAAAATFAVGRLVGVSLSG